MKWFSHVLTIIFVLWAPFASAEVKKIDLSATSGKTKFTAIGKPAMLRIAGEGSGPSGFVTIENKKIAGEFSVELKTLQTGIELRDDHMKNKYLEVGQFPKAKLNVETLELEKNLSEINGKIEKIPFTGKLDFHGVVKPVSGQFDLEPDGKKMNIKAGYSLNLSDFKIQIPSYAGIKVADKVDIEVNFSIER